MAAGGVTEKLLKRDVSHKFDAAQKALVDTDYQKGPGMSQLAATTLLSGMVRAVVAQFEAGSAPARQPGGGFAFDRGGDPLPPGWKENLDDESYHKMQQGKSVLMAFLEALLEAGWRRHHANASTASVGSATAAPAAAPGESSTYGTGYTSFPSSVELGAPGSPARTSTWSDAEIAPQAAARAQGATNPAWDSGSVHLDSDEDGVADSVSIRSHRAGRAPPGATKKPSLNPGRPRPLSRTRNRKRSTPAAKPKNSGRKPYGFTPPASKGVPMGGEGAASAPTYQNTPYDLYRGGSASGAVAAPAPDSMPAPAPHTHVKPKVGGGQRFAPSKSARPASPPEPRRTTITAAAKHTPPGPRHRHSPPVPPKAASPVLPVVAPAPAPVPGSGQVAIVAGDHTARQVPDGSRDQVVVARRQQLQLKHTQEDLELRKRHQEEIEALQRHQQQELQAVATLQQDPTGLLLTDTPGHVGPVIAAASARQPPPSDHQQVPGAAAVQAVLLSRTAEFQLRLAALEAAKAVEVQAEHQVVPPPDLQDMVAAAVRAAMGRLQGDLKPLLVRVAELEAAQASTAQGGHSGVLAAVPTSPPLHGLTFDDMAGQMSAMKQQLLAELRQELAHHPAPATSHASEAITALHAQIEAQRGEQEVLRGQIEALRQERPQSAMRGGDPGDPQGLAAVRAEVAELRRHLAVERGPAGGAEGEAWSRLDKHEAEVDATKQRLARLEGGQVSRADLEALQGRIGDIDESVKQAIDSLSRAAEDARGNAAEAGTAAAQTQAVVMAFQDQVGADLRELEGQLVAQQGQLVAARQAPSGGLHSRIADVEANSQALMAGSERVATALDGLFKQVAGLRAELKSVQSAQRAAQRSQVRRVSSPAAPAAGSFGTSRGTRGSGLRGHRPSK